MALRAHPDAIALAWCDNTWCGSVYDLQDGWGGRCPSCLALEDEHLAGRHEVVIETCVQCRLAPGREPSAGLRATRRAG